MDLSSCRGIHVSNGLDGHRSCTPTLQCVETVVCETSDTLTCPCPLILSPLFCMVMYSRKNLNNCCLLCRSWGVGAGNASCCRCCCISAAAATSGYLIVGCDCNILCYVVFSSSKTRIKKPTKTTETFMQEKPHAAQSHIFTRSHIEPFTHSRNTKIIHSHNKPWMTLANFGLCPEGNWEGLGF